MAVKNQPKTEEKKTLDELKLSFAKNIIQEFIESGLSQMKMAKTLGLTQPRFCNILNLQLEKFSLEAIMEVVLKMGYSVNVGVKKTKVVYTVV